MGIYKNPKTSLAAGFEPQTSVPDDERLHGLTCDIMKHVTLRDFFDVRCLTSCGILIKLFLYILDNFGFISIVQQHSSSPATPGVYQRHSRCHLRQYLLTITRAVSHDASDAHQLWSCGLDDVCPTSISLTNQSFVRRHFTAMRLTVVTGCL